MTPQQQEELTRQLFIHLAQWSGPGYWDWQALANRAHDAAEQFQVVAIQRQNPQAAVPLDAPPPATPSPDIPADISVASIPSAQPVAPPVPQSV